MLKILSGEYRSRVLLTPAGDDVTRPMTARVKESVLAMLRGWFEGARVLDLFAGVGTIGLEAASRGASEVVCVERDRGILAYLERNIRDLGCGDRVRALAADALSPALLSQLRGPFDLIFIDPPYEVMESPQGLPRVIEAVRRCRGLMGERGFLVLRRPATPASPPPPSFMELLGPEIHRHGGSMEVLLYAPARACDAGP